MRPPLVLCLDATDPIGASGLAADLKTLTALGVYGAGIATMVMSGSTQGTASLHRLPGEVVTSQLDAVLADVRPDATKIGALGSAAAAREVARRLREHRAELGTIVLDAVMTDVDGTALATAEAAEVIARELLPLADVLVANPLEAAQLLDRGPAADLEALREQALALAELGPRAVLLTGARLESADAADVLVHPGGTDVLRSPRVSGAHTRGAGATLSAAIAGQYARLAEFGRAGERTEVGEDGDHDDDVTILASARDFLASAMADARTWELSRTPGTGHGPLNHLITLSAG
ncbi:bifunctional hydroxymethylpyrimidine kinase/phosphomethylpyrimidine kinase [Brachybacterium hainanense]|uniref:Hydroxymethylpyrimidine/phosphomethylpyrimidine kinase n=1 Tax=Brachybacterium hainanense TaxID=1541174 RepID=A0ABV6RG61_9MICO